MFSYYLALSSGEIKRAGPLVETHHEAFIIWQCAQRNRLCFQYLVININKHLSKSKQIAPKWVIMLYKTRVVLWRDWLWVDIKFS